MNIIVNIDNKKFSLNGVQYFKNYISNVAGNNLKIINAYDSNDVLLDWVDYTQISVNSVVYGSVTLLQQNLIDVCFNRSVGQSSYKQTIVLPYFVFASYNTISYMGFDPTMSVMYYWQNVNQNNPNLLVPAPYTAIGLINDNGIIDKISFLAQKPYGPVANIDIALFITDTVAGLNPVQIFVGTNLEGKVILENLNINVQKNKVLHMFIKNNETTNQVNFMYNFTISIK